MALVNVIKWEANTGELVHKFQVDDLRLGSQLVVYPSQTAFFVKGGKIFDEFICGTFTIKSENVPLLNKVFNLPFGGDSPFQSEVWFINQISMLDCKWGTASPIQIEDPKYGVIVPIRSFGQYGFRISNPRVFLERLIGNMPTFSTEKVVTYFRGVILSKLTAIISQKLYADSLSIININSHVEEISEYAKVKLTEVFAEYGVELEMFSVIAINVNEEDPSFQKLKETKDSLARINIMGKENYRMERSFNVLDSAAENEGNGMIGAAVGIGAGVGIGSQISTMVKEQINTNPETPPTLPTAQYYLGINGQQQGPFDFESVKNAITSHQIDENILIWKRGMANWTKIGEVSEFSDIFNNCPPPLPQL
ncbi:SPFH domain-containing protein [uncultured Duncaniella sp.]|uniref:SPFH domain-containing protein n=1 Tax=uncultured Duncaniella sp. TaxID=2768039 RepID=UPI002623B78F|nr:SPFH domain-containing protein [uncultured Duncaniella sp.]